MIAKMIGAYQVIAKLGEGGMGEVHRARDASAQINVVLNWFEELRTRVPAK